MALMVLSALFLCLCVAAASFDVNQLRIPNWLNLSIAALFLPAAAFSGLPLELLGGHLLAGALAFVIGYGLFMFGVFGGGDAKMIPAVMLWMGPAAALAFVYYMALVGGACALVILLVRRTMPAEVIPGFMRKPFEDKANVPYGVAIAAGALFAGAGSPLLAGLFNTAGISG